MLMVDIATRAFTARALCEQWEISKEDLKAFVDEHREQLTAMRERIERGEAPQGDGDVTPDQLDELWISKKAERLKRYQTVADILYEEIKSGRLVGAELSTAVREFRSYATVVANELGQLMHRGSGDASEDGKTVSYEISGIDVETLR